jgi:hypothetical protein
MGPAIRRIGHCLPIRQTASQLFIPPFRGSPTGFRVEPGMTRFFFFSVILDSIQDPDMGPTIRRMGHCLPIRQTASQLFIPPFRGSPTGFRVEPGMTRFFFFSVILDSIQDPDMGPTIRRMGHCLPIRQTASQLFVPPIPTATGSHQLRGQGNHQPDQTHLHPDARTRFSPSLKSGMLAYVRRIRVITRGTVFCVDKHGIHA